MIDSWEYLDAATLISIHLALYPGFLTLAFITCSTNMEEG